MNVEMLSSEHYRRVRAMMLGFGQKVRDRPGLGRMISDDERLLRVRLVIEEALEFSQAMGFNLSVTEDHDDYIYFEDLVFEDREEFDMAKAADALADISVVATGAMVAMGIPDLPLYDLVDANNKMKIDNGSIDKHGKFVKSQNHPSPDFEGLISSIDAGIAFAEDQKRVEGYDRRVAKCDRCGKEKDTAISTVWNILDPVGSIRRMCDDCTSSFSAP